MSKTPLALIILAAGKGTRMVSALPKVLHPLAAKPMILHVLSSASSLAPTTMITVIGPEMEPVQTVISGHYPAMRYCLQEHRLGTAHAVRTALPLFEDFSGNVLILYGDTPLIQSKTLTAMLSCLHDNSSACLTILGFHVKNPSVYGRLLLAEDGSLEAIVEYQDATPEQRAITLCNSGVIAIKSQALFSLLPLIQNTNSKGEFYLTDLVGLARTQGFSCHFLEAEEAEVQGINSRIELAEAEKRVQERLRLAAMEQGATLIQPETVTLCADSRIGKDVTIEPFVVLGPHVTIEDHVCIRAFCHIEGALIKKGASIGPFARIRPGTIIEEQAHVGNFVEIKNTILGKAVKAGHLSYLGDAVIGERTNIGAGTITCNYDGFTKSRTHIEEDCLIGSNTALIAPLSIGKGSIIGAGSVITEDVPADALAIARTRQQILKKSNQDERKASQKRVLL